MKRALLVTAVLVVTLAAFVYERPLTVYDVSGHAWLLIRGFRSEYLDVGGNRVHAMVGGDGPPLVLIHGLASRGEDYALIMPALAKHHRLYVPDLLGFGRSARPDIDYSVASEVEMIRAYFDAKHIDRADVMAASMGGWIALQFAAEHPERVRRLVLVDSAGFPFQTAMTPTTFTPRNREELLALLALQTDRIKWLPDFIARDLLRQNHEHAWILQRSLASMLSGRDLMEGRTRRVTMPVLLAWGEKDRIVPLAVGRRMQRELRDARLVTYPECGHLAIVECRGKLLPEVERFLRSASDRRTP